MKDGDLVTKDQAWEPLVYVDKLCGLVIAAGVGYLMATYMPVGHAIVWAIVGVALATKNPASCVVSTQ